MVKLEAADLLMVKAGVDNFMVSCQEVESKDHSITHHINANPRPIDIRVVPIKATVASIIIPENHTSNITTLIHTEAKAEAMANSKQGDVVKAGPTITVIIITSISIMVMINRLNNTAHTVVYVEVSIILQSIATRKNMI